MGCWNKTCGLSNLHIYAGTPVYVFVLEENKHKDDHCYATSLYRPLLLPFESVYNDYGGGESSSGPGFEMIMDGIRKLLIETPAGENKYHDIAVSRDGFGEEQFFDAVHENRMNISYRHDFSDPTPVQFTMFRKDIVDDILENRVIEDYVGNGKGTGGYDNNYNYYTFKDIVADIKPLFKELKQIIASLQTEGVSDAVIFSMCGGLEYLVDYNHPNKAAKWFRSDTYRYSTIVDMRKVLSDTIKVGTNEAYDKLEIILTEYLKGKFIDGFMHAARKTWIPGGHEGSQNDSGDALRILCSATIKALDREREEYGEDDE
jgi:hypothetical protein